MDQNRTPLLDAVAAYARREPAYFKIPAHRFERGISPRWRKWTGDGIFRFDLTEAEGLDDLHCAEGVICRIVWGQENLVSGQRNHLRQ